MSEHEPDAIRDLASGQAWSTFCREIDALAQDLRDAAGPSSPIDLAESHRYLTRLLRSGFEQIMEGGDARQPAFFESLHETLKSGWDNPDNIHTNAYVNGSEEYRIRGTRGDAHYMTIALYGGSLGKEGGRRTIAYVDVDDLRQAADGSFELGIGPEPRHENWIQSAPDASTAMVRQTFWDKTREQPARLEIERVTDERAEPLDAAFVASALQRIARYVRGSNRAFLRFAKQFRDLDGEVYLSDPVRSSQTLGIAEMRYLSAWWRLPSPEHAVVIDVRPPECRYWGIVLSNFWGESFDYRYHPVHTNKRRATLRPDGSVRFVISEAPVDRDEGNWLAAAGHSEGLWTLRWLEADEHPVPTARVVQRSEL